MNRKTKKQTIEWPDIYDGKDEGDLDHAAHLQRLAPETLQKIADALSRCYPGIKLKTKPGYDLRGKLHRAACNYYFHVENKTGKHTPLVTGPLEKKKRSVRKVAEATREYFDFVNKHLGVMVGLTHDGTVMNLLATLQEIEVWADIYAEFAPSRKKDRDPAMGAFVSTLLLIYEDATGKEMTSRCGYEGQYKRSEKALKKDDQKGEDVLVGPYGPAFDFVKSCLPLVGRDQLKRDRIQDLLQEVIRKRELIKQTRTLI